MSELPAPAPLPDVESGGYSPFFTALWPRTVAWVEPFYDGEHLFHTTHWLVKLAPDLFKRTAEWLLGNSPRVTPLVVLLVLAAVVAPIVASGRDRHAWTIRGTPRSTECRPP